MFGETGRGVAGIVGEGKLRSFAEGKWYLYSFSVNCLFKKMGVGWGKSSEIGRAHV